MAQCDDERRCWRQRQNRLHSERTSTLSLSCGHSTCWFVSYIVRQHALVIIVVQERFSMRYRLLTVTGATRFGQAWRITPSVSLHVLVDSGPLTGPEAGDEVELRLPDGLVRTARIVSTGLDPEKDVDGNRSRDRRLTISIRCAPDLQAVPPGTEIWLTRE